jgi:hypothetical protein
VRRWSGVIGIERRPTTRGKHAQIHLAFKRTEAFRRRDEAVAASARAAVSLSDGCAPTPIMHSSIVRRMALVAAPTRIGGD